MLTLLTDGDGEVTVIESSGGVLAGVTGPDGQRASISADADGLIRSVTLPGGLTYSMGYDGGGLMTSFTRPNGGVSTFEYDAEGRLIRDTNAAGGGWSLSRARDGTGYTVSMTSGAGRATAYRRERRSGGGERKITTGPAGQITTREITPTGGESVNLPDGSTVTSQLQPDPRWGMLAPLTSSLTLRTPQGRTRTMSASRTVTLSNPGDLMSLTAQTDTLTVNGKSSTRAWSATTRKLTTTSPAGRISSVTLDNLGRLTGQTMAGLLPVNYSYDARGRLAMTSQGTRSSSFAYDAAGFLNSVTEPLGRVTSFNYDAAGRVLSQTMPDGRSVNYTYDANGKVTSITPPGRSAHVIAYAPVEL